VLSPGTGNERPGPDDVVQVVYRARTETGHLFDSSGDNDTPKTLSVGGVIPGLAEPLQLMTVGQKMRVWIPPNLPSDKLREAKKGTLMFDIELVGFTRVKEYPSLPIELTSPRKEE
jgi:FKBP-type peptidyl-prolyl cis-trans isomerase